MILQKQIFDNIMTPVVLFDLSHTIIAANPAACETSGRTEQELVGQKCYRARCGSAAPPAWFRQIVGERKTVRIECEGTWPGVYRDYPAGFQRGRQVDLCAGNRPRYFRSEAFADFCPVRNVLRSGNSCSCEINTNGHECLVTATPIRDRHGRITHMAESAIDLTEINEGKRKLEVAMHAAQAADRAQSYFLAVGPQQEPDVPAGAFAGVAGVGEI